MPDLPVGNLRFRTHTYIRLMKSEYLRKAVTTIWAGFGLNERVTSNVVSNFVLLQYFSRFCRLGLDIGLQERVAANGLGAISLWR